MSAGWRGEGFHRQRLPAIVPPPVAQPPSRDPRMHRTFLLSVSLLLGAAVAQRPTFEHQKRATMLEYGTVSVGSHNIAELPVGGTWRMGANGTTVWRLAMPAISGSTVVPPGDYAVSLQRTTDATCAIVPRGSGRVLGGKDDLQVAGPLGKAAKPTKKLVIEWAKDETKDEKPLPGGQSAKLTVTFGDHEWVASMTFPGHKVASVTGGKLAVFALPAALLAGRDKAAVPVAVLTKGEESWNLLVGKEEARLVPWLQANTSTRDTPSIDETRVTKGTVDALEAKPPAERETLEHLAASLTKGELVVDLAFGQEALRVRVPEPKGKGK